MHFLLLAKPWNTKSETVIILIIHMLSSRLNRGMEMIRRCRNR